MRNTNSPIHKEVNRFVWILKGQLVPDGYSNKDYVDTHEIFLNRLWGNDENYVHEEGFEEAYAEKYK